MNPAEQLAIARWAEAELAKLAELGDEEHVHIEADRILCRVLKAHGHDNLVAAFEALDKWYS